MQSTEKVPSAGESDHGIALDDEQLCKLVQGFKGSALFPIISVAAFTGARDGTKYWPSAGVILIQ